MSMALEDRMQKIETIWGLWKAYESSTEKLAVFEVLEYCFQVRMPAVWRVASVCGDHLRTLN